MVLFRKDEQVQTSLCRALMPHRTPVPTGSQSRARLQPPWGSPGPLEVRGVAPCELGATCPAVRCSGGSGLLAFLPPDSHWLPEAEVRVLRGLGSEVLTAPGDGQKRTEKWARHTVAVPSSCSKHCRRWSVALWSGPVTTCVLSPCCRLAGLPPRGPPSFLLGRALCPPSPFLGFLPHFGRAHPD